MWRGSYDGYVVLFDVDDAYEMRMRSVYVWGFCSRIISFLYHLILTYNSNKEHST